MKAQRRRTVLAEISFDLKMEENMSFVEGTFRLSAQEWQVFIFTRRPIAHPVVNAHAKWDSGVTGVQVQFPRSERLNKDSVLEILAATLGVNEWREVRGPDSIQLR
jgi:hypothetical protein